MIRRDICLLLALILMGGMIFWITQPRTPAPPDEAGTPGPAAPAAPKALTPSPVTALKAEKSLLVGALGEKGEASERFWENSVSNLLPSIVSVQSFRSDSKQVVAGPSATGVMVSGEGHLLCPDLLIRDAVALRVRMAGGTVEAARVLAVDHSLGSALLQIGRSETAGVQWVRPSVHEKADRFLVVGRTPSGSEWYSTALLSSVSTAEPVGETTPPTDRLLVFDAPVAEGQGAVVADRRGSVVGLVHIEESPGLARRYWVMPAHLVEARVKQMIRLGRPAFAQLGAMVQVLDRDTARSLGLDRTSGVLVSEVVPGLAAAAAGIEPGDVIQGTGSFRVGSPQDLRAIMAQAPVDQPLPVEIWRKGEVRTVVVAPSVTPAPYSTSAGTVDPFPGDSILKSLAVRAANNGVLEVSAFRPDQVAASASLLPGDRVLEVDGEALSTQEDYNRLLLNTRERDVIRLRVDSGGVRRYLTLKRL